MNNDKTRVIDFLQVLNGIITEQCPNTEILQTDSGDYITDVEFELREGKHRFRYRPYDLYYESGGNYEESILKIVNSWKEIINKKDE